MHSEAQRTLDDTCFRCHGDRFIVLRDHHGQPVRRIQCPRCKGAGERPPEGS